MLRANFKLYFVILLLITPLSCSHKTFHHDLYPSTDFYALKVFTTLNIINENFEPNSGATFTNISLKQSSFAHYQVKSRIETNQKSINTVYTYVIEASGNFMKKPLSVAALAIEPDRYKGHEYPKSSRQPQKISTNTMSLLATNTFYSNLAGAYTKGLPGPTGDHKFFTLVTGELPKINSTITSGVFYPKSIGITTPLSVISLAYFPQGAFQGTIPSRSENTTS